MSSRPLLVMSSLMMVSAALAGCFGGDAEPSVGEVIDGSKLPAFETTLFLNQVMFHPYKGGMLSAWAFSEKPDDPAFKIPEFRVTEGQTVRITFTNTLDNGMNHTIHWHGLHVPWEMDGVPYLTQDPVEAGESFTYEFVAKPAGTHFFHCHVDTAHHMDMGMYGVLIVDPADGERYEFDSEETLVFDDWDSTHLHQNGNADTQMTIDSATDNSGDPLNQLDRTEGQIRDAYNNPQYPVVSDVYSQTGNPARLERDWYPVTYAPWQPEYDTWTIDSMSYPLTEPISIKEGETKRLRFINVGNTIFALHVHGHHFKVTHTDGYPLDMPYMKDTLLVGPGERYDVMLEGNNPGIWMFHDHMSLHETNDHISPGGIMTHIVYEGFEVEGADGHEHGGFSAKQIGRMTAGDFLGLYK